MSLGVRNDVQYLRPEGWSETSRAQQDEGSQFEAATDAVQDDPLPVDESSTGLAEDSDPLYPQDSTADAPPSGDDAESTDDQGIPTWNLDAWMQRLDDIEGDPERWDDLAEDDQHEIRGLLMVGFLDSARGKAQDQSELESSLADRRQEMLDALPAMAGLEPVVDEVHDDVLGQVEDAMTPAMREAIEQGLADPDNHAAWSAFRIEATRQIDSAVRLEAQTEPNVDAGDVPPRSEERVISDYTGLLLELAAPQGNGRDALIEQLETVSHRILVDRPVEAMRQGPGGLIEGLERETRSDRTGQPMSSIRVGEILKASEDALREELSTMQAGERREVADQLNVVATRANTEPGGEEGLAVLAGALVDEGLMDSPLDGTSGSSVPTFYEEVMTSTEEGYGIDLSLHVAAEFVRRGDTDRAEIILQEARSRSRTFFDSVGETAAEFKSTFRDEPQLVNANFQEYLSPQEQADGVDALRTKLREENGELYERFQHNRDGIVATLSALEHLPEELAELDGARRFGSFYDDSMETLQTEQRPAAGITDFTYEEALQVAVFETEFGTEDLSPLPTETRQRLTEMPESYYRDILTGFDDLQAMDERDGQAEVTAPPELVELREALGDDIETAGEELQRNPEAAFAFSQYLYLRVPPDDMPGREEIPGAVTVGQTDFLARTTRNLIGTVIEIKPLRASTIFSNNGAAVQQRFPASATNQQIATESTNRLVRQGSSKVFGRGGITRLDEVAGVINVEQRSAQNNRLNRTIQPMEGLAGMRWVGPAWAGGFAALNAWGINNWMPTEFFTSEEVTSDSYINGAWTGYFIAITGQQAWQAGSALTVDAAAATGRGTGPAAASFSRAPGIRTLAFNSGVNKVMLPLMAATAINEHAKGDHLMAGAWWVGTAGAGLTLAGTFVPAIGATAWAGPVAAALWVVSAAAVLGINQYRHVEAANHFEDPMKWYLEGAGLDPDRAHEMGNATGDGEMRYPLLNAVSETYLGIPPETLGRAFANDGMPEGDLGALVEVTHYLDIEPTDDGELPPASELSDEEKYRLALIYRLLPDEYKGETPEIFAGGLPPLWYEAEPVEPGMPPPLSEVAIRQPGRIQTIASDLMWREAQENR